MNLEHAATLLTALVSVLVVVIGYAKLRPEVRSLDTRTETERYGLEERRRTEQREAEERLAEKLSSLVENLSSSYQSLLTTVNSAHDKVVEGMRSELRDVRERLTHMEAMLIQERDSTAVLNATIAGLNSTVARLNDAVSDRDATIRRIREKLNHTQGIDADEVIAESIAPERRTTPPH